MRSIGGVDNAACFSYPLSPLYGRRSHDTPVGRLAFSSHLQVRLLDFG
jgi:hypothetical protein